MFAIVVVLVVVEFPLQTEIVILFVGVAKMFWAVGELFYGFFQQYERMDFVSKSLSLKGFLCVLCLTAGMTLAGSVIWGAAGYAAAYVVVLFAYDIPKTLDLLRLASAIEQFPVYAINGLRQLFPSRLILRNIGRLTWLAAPAGLTLALFSLADNIPRYFIERHMGERELGLFAALSYFVLAGYMFMSALGQSAVPKLARYYATGESLAFRRLVLKVISIGIAVGLLGVLGARFVGRQLLVLVYNPEYAEHGTLLFWLMVAGVMLYVGGALGVAFTATRAFKKMPLPYFAIAIVSFVLSATLIPAYGLVGAAWVLLGVYALLCVVMILLLKSTPLPS
jgi:O-antigen/teichoic acid export membrane protein